MVLLESNLRTPGFAWAYGSRRGVCRSISVVGFRSDIYTR